MLNFGCILYFLSCRLPSREISTATDKKVGAELKDVLHLAFLIRKDLSFEPEPDFNIMQNKKLKKGLAISLANSLP
jgi:hypothetical protein